MLATAFHNAAELLWELIDAQQEASKAAHDTAAAAAGSGDQPMTDAAQSSSSNAAEPAAAAAPAQPAAPALGGLKDPRQLMETVLVKMLAVYEQLANANVLLSVPQVKMRGGGRWHNHEHQKRRQLRRFVLLLALPPLPNLT